MCERAQSRSSFGKSYTRHQMVQEYIADSRIEIDAMFGHEIGTLRPGAAADMLAFTVEEGEFPLEDTHLRVAVAARMIRPYMTFKAGEPLLPGKTDAQIWNLVGVTPMLGQNDDGHRCAVGRRCPASFFR